MELGPAAEYLDNTLNGVKTELGGALGALGIKGESAANPCWMSFGMGCWMGRVFSYCFLTIHATSVCYQDYGLIRFLSSHKREVF